MVRAMRAIRLALTSALLGLAAMACAPVQSKTHFQRWDEHADKVAAEEAAAAPEGGPGSTAKGTSTPAKAAPTPVASGTPPITRTSTGSRVVRPQDAPPPPDEDVIY